MESAHGVAKFELSVKIGSDPIAGTLQLSPSSSWSFVGWLALTRSIEQALVSATTATQR